MHVYIAVAWPVFACHCVHCSRVSMYDWGGALRLMCVHVYIHGIIVAAYVTLSGTDGE